MRGSKTNITKADLLKAMKTPPPGGYFVWNGKDEDDRPMAANEMRAAFVKKMGRPLGGHKTSTTIRLDDDVLDAFKTNGKGWQTRINAALKDWLKTHSPT